MVGSEAWDKMLFIGNGGCHVTSISSTVDDLTISTAIFLSTSYQPCSTPPVSFHWPGWLTCQLGQCDVTMLSHTFLSFTSPHPSDSLGFPPERSASPWTMQQPAAWCIAAWCIVAWWRRRCRRWKLRSFSWRFRRRGTKQQKGDGNPSNSWNL